MILVDSHVHFYTEAYTEDLEAVMQKAFADNVKYFLLPGISSAHQKAINTMAETYPDSCFPMIGLHPTDVFQNYRDELDFIQQELSRQNSYIALGETGLDLHWDAQFLPEQKKSFAQHLQWAIDYQLPLSIHVREAFNQAFEVLSDFKNQKLKGVFHCFSGSIEQAKEVLKYGFALGISGVLTYKNGRVLKEVAAYFPLEDMVLETDAPWLSPEPYRGKRNDSSNIRIIAETLAQIKGVTIEKVAEITTANCFRIFDKITREN